MIQRLRLFLLILTTLSVVADSRAAEISSLRLGFAGVGKVGKWLPLTLEATDLPAGEVQLQAAFVDPRGDRCVQSVDAATVGANGTATFRGCFCVGRLEGSGEISLVSAEGEVLYRQFIRHGEAADLANLPTPADSTDSADAPQVQRTLRLYRLNVPLLMTFGEVAGIPEFLRNAEQYSGSTAILKGVPLGTLSELPEDPRALESIDFVLLATDFTASDAQTAALRRWVEFGGDLYFSVGGNVGEFLQSSPGIWLNQFFDLQPEAVSIRELSSLQSFVPGASRLETGRRTVPIAISRSDQSQEDVDFLSGPIVARQGIGAGTATFVAVDINERPMDRWLSLPQFYEVLILGDKLSRSSGSATRSSRISQSGISELATQMMAALDAQPAEGVWSTWSIMALMIAWLALIGPVDYFLVSRVLNRPQLTWITFPSLIGLGVGLIYSATTGPVDDTLNQIHMVDVFNQDNRSAVRTLSWMSFSSTDTARHNLAASTDMMSEQGEPANLVWSGRPEDVYGGMYRAGGIGLGRQDYGLSQGAVGELQNVPVLTKGSRQVLAEWEATTETPWIDSTLQAAGFGLLNGSFEHNLPGTIRDYVVFHGNRVYQPPGGAELSPGVRWTARQTGARATDMKAFLNGAVLVKSDNPVRKSGTQTATPYNIGSRDPQYILTMATFFDVAGGSKYVGLTQDSLRHLELSDTIRLNHAVLIGTLETPATRLMVDGEFVIADASTTVVRLLIPVTRRPVGKLLRTDEEIEQAAERARSGDDSPRP